MRHPGSKGKISRHIVPLIPYDCLYYHEPFLGLGYVYKRLRLVGRSFKDYFLSDLFQPLVNYHLACQGDQTYGDIVERLIELRSMLLPESEHEEEIRAEFEECCYRLRFWHDPLDIIFVGCYANGQWLGRHRRDFASFHPMFFRGGISVLTPEKVLAWRELLAPATIQCLDAMEWLRALNEREDAYDHFVYIDPPYVTRDLGGRNRFQMYQHDWLTLEPQLELLELLKNARFRFILSMGDSPYTREWYVRDKTLGFHAYTVPAVNSGKRRKATRVHQEEWLILNFAA